MLFCPMRLFMTKGNCSQEMLHVRIIICNGQRCHCAGLCGQKYQKRLFRIPDTYHIKSNCTNVNFLGIGKGKEPLGNRGIGDGNKSGNLDLQSIGSWSTELSHAHIGLSEPGTIIWNIFPAICHKRFVMYGIFLSDLNLTDLTLADKAT